MKNKDDLYMPISNGHDFVKNFACAVNDLKLTGYPYLAKIKTVQPKITVLKSQLAEALFKV